MTDISWLPDMRFSEPDPFAEGKSCQEVMEVNADSLNGK
jgi:hypothetical protein